MSDIEWVFRSAALDADAGVRHGFFTRLGGVSEGPFESLNCGFGSGDSPHRILRNRAIAMDCLGLPADRLLTARQIHSATVVTVERPWRREEAHPSIATGGCPQHRPRADSPVFRSYAATGSTFIRFGRGFTGAVLMLVAAGLAHWLFLGVFGIALAAWFVFALPASRVEVGSVW